MSRIGKKPILIPEGIKIDFKDQKIEVSGPKGSLQRIIRPEIGIEIKDGQIFVSPKNLKLRKQESKKIKSYLGLTRALIANMVSGIDKGFEKRLEIEGIGYKAALEGQDLNLKVGFSHQVKIKAQPGIKFAVEKNIIIVSGIDKEAVSQIASKIRKVQPPEPYKGKGIKYAGEVVKRKEGKKVVASTQ